MYMYMCMFISRWGYGAAKEMDKSVYTYDPWLMCEYAGFIEKLVRVCQFGIAVAVYIVVFVSCAYLVFKLSAFGDR